MSKSREVKAGSAAYDKLLAMELRAAGAPLGVEPPLTATFFYLYTGFSRGLSLNYQIPVKSSQSAITGIYPMETSLTRF